MQMGTKYLWLGSYQSSEQFEKMLARNIGQASGYASQKGIIKGLDYYIKGQDSLDTIGVVSYPPYPMYPKVKVSREAWSRTGTSRDVTIGYIDIKYITYIFRNRSLQKEVKNWGRGIDSENVVVIVYEPSVAKLRAAIYLKRKYKAKIFVIIPDIPELVNLGANKVIKAGKRYAAKRMQEQFKMVDGFVLYSECMANYYHLKDEQWILMEGVYDPDESDIESVPDDHSTIRLIYCGALDKFRGIPQLLDAFNELRDKDYELWFTGAGESDNLIRERALKDDRIHHYGYLDNREEVLKLQKRADILIHIRNVASPAAPYCFPSKIFEYLATGKTVISVRIPGIPEEYFKYMIPIENLTSDGIRNAIKGAVIKDREERAKLGAEAREFVIDKKNSYVQAKKILDFIEKQGELKQ